MILSGSAISQHGQSSDSVDKISAVNSESSSNRTNSKATALDIKQSHVNLAGEPSAKDVAVSSQKDPKKKKKKKKKKNIHDHDDPKLPVNSQLDQVRENNSKAGRDKRKLCPGNKKDATTSSVVNKKLKVVG